VPSGLEGNLRAHRECVELGAGIRGVGRSYLFGDVAVQVVEHETYVAIDVPVQTRAVDRLLSTGHAVCGPQLIVQIRSADAAGDLPRPPTSAPAIELQPRQARKIIIASNVVPEIFALKENGP